MQNGPHSEPNLQSRETVAHVLLHAVRGDTTAARRLCPTDPIVFTLEPGSSDVRSVMARERHFVN